MSEPSHPLPLRGVRCGACGRTAFPAQEFGCEGCGAYGAGLEPVELTGHGTVLALLTVYEHPDPAVSTPATIAGVQLDEGPVLRARVSGVREAGVAVTAAADGNGLIFHSTNGAGAR
ncbi:Zn-ribbon domain-containing OB-fold protein [Nonomuraea lactucae]|uniref:Zn-ribbon domain-containing OB-fold protein n=1 Tax=Nonomuraea lactucae TaxID=2249762 RepID=UPI000DE5336C|nr:OB-fold domain-containing protein [Nonomuraea lactucae]